MADQIADAGGGISRLVTAGHGDEKINATQNNAKRTRKDKLIELIVGCIRHLVVGVVFSLFGYGIIKCLTLGRYPRTADPRRREAPDYLLLNLVGSVGIVVLIAWLSACLSA